MGISDIKPTKAFVEDNEQQFNVATWYAGDAEIIAIIDADGIPYKASYMAEGLDLTIDEAFNALDNIFMGVLNNTKATHYLAFITGHGNFRKELRVDYKQKREEYKHLQQLKYFKELKEYMHKRWKCSVVNGIEADDACGICLTKYPKAIVCSDDLDLLQFQGLHYKITKKIFIVVKGIGELYYGTHVDKHGAGKPKLYGNGEMLFYLQMLKGDKDECEGLKGYGDKKSYNFLKDCKTVKELKEVTYNCYKDFYKNDEDPDLYKEKYELNYRLLRLLRNNNDFIIPELLPYGNKVQSTS